MEEEGLKITFSEYQTQAARTAIYPFSDAVEPNFVHEGILYLALGLAGEAGEVANKVKKLIRDNDGLITPEALGKIVSELGDVQWYLAEMARLFGVDLGLVAQHNLSKLSVRAEKDLLSGTGDFRGRELPQSIGEAIARDEATGTGRQLHLPEPEEDDGPKVVRESVTEHVKLSKDERRNREVL